MKNSRFALLLSAICFGVVAVSPAYAASKKKPTAPAQHASPKIAAVSATSITINDGSAAKTYAITQFTEINVNGTRATAAELKPGMTVSVVVSTDSTKLSRITATGK